MLILDQRTLQIKYRVPATDIYRISLSPFLDDVAVVHVKAVSFIGASIIAVCLELVLNLHCFYKLTLFLIKIFITVF